MLAADVESVVVVKKTNLKRAVLLCASIWTTPASALPDLQERAESALVAGDPAQTVVIAGEILATNPDSFVGLYLLGLAQMELGNLEEAAASGQRAYDIAATEEARFQAARLIASARFQNAQYVRSEFWLRRAANHAQTEQDAQSIVLAYINTVRANPLSVEFTAFVAPTDNINNGSNDGILRLESIGLTFELPEDRRALSGIAFAIGADLDYRLSQDASQITSLTGRLSGETYLLSSESKDLLESSPITAVRDVEGRDFATLVAEIGLRRRQNNISPFGPVSAGISFGTFWEGGERLVDYQDLDLQQTFPIDPDTSINLGVSFRDQQSLTPFLLDSKTYDWTGSYNRGLANNDLFQLSFLYRQREAGPEGSFDEYQIGFGYGLAEPIAGTLISTSMQVGYRDYPEFTTTLDGRRDRFVGAEVNATFVEFTYFGFSPSVTLSARRTESSAEENTSSTVQFLMGIESNF